MICSRLSRILILCVLTAGVTALGGCESDDTSPNNLGSEPSVFTTYVQLSPTAPPSPQEEAVATPDNVRSQIWRPGYWHYNGGNWDWVAGQLMARPSPTAVWSPDHWIEHTYGWAFLPGYWQ